MKTKVIKKNILLDSLNENIVIHICTDGKAREGCIDHKTGRTESDLTIYDANSGCVIATVSLATKQGEKAGLEQALEKNLGQFKGTLLTSDAGMTSILKGDALAKAEIDALIQIKGNSGSSFEEVQSLLWGNVLTRETKYEKGHGREEYRTTRVIDLAFVKDNEIQDKYPTVEAVVQIEKWSKNIKSGEISHSFRYYLGTHKICEIPISAVSQTIKEHWAIETFHNVKDVTLGEDRSMIVSSNASRFTGRIRSMVARMGKVYGSTKKFIENFSQDPREVVYA